MTAEAESDQQAAARIVLGAWKEASEQGISTDLFASTALSLALTTLVKTHGNDVAKRIAERLVEAVIDGKNGDGS